jgi:hypothetical protein
VLTHCFPRPLPPAEAARLLINLRAEADADWKSEDGHYKVQIENYWWTVPDEAVITEPNRDGRTMVWPVYHNDYGNRSIEIRCFMPGSMV